MIQCSNIRPWSTLAHRHNEVRLGVHMHVRWSTCAYREKPGEPTEMRSLGSVPRHEVDDGSTKHTYDITKIHVCNASCKCVVHACIVVLGAGMLTLEAWCNPRYWLTHLQT